MEHLSTHIAPGNSSIWCSSDLFPYSFQNAEIGVEVTLLPVFQYDHPHDEAI